MAEGIDRGGGGSRVFDYSVLFDDGIGEILERLDGEDKGAVMDELMDGYDMPALMEMRVKIFRFAKSKLMKSLEGEGPGDLDPAFASCVPRERIEDAHKAVAEWVLIARRGKQRVVQDSISLLAYMSDEVKLFPHGVVRRSVKRKNKRSRRKYNVPKRVSHDPKQPLIPFTSGTSETNATAPVDEGNDDGSESNISGEGDSSTDGSFFSGDEEDDFCESVTDVEVNKQRNDMAYKPVDDIVPVTHVHVESGSNVPNVNVRISSAVNVPHSGSAQSIPGETPQGRPAEIQPVEHAQTVKTNVAVEDLPTTQRSPKQSLRESNSCTISENKAQSTKSHKTMTTQTEWTLWGSPVSEASSTLSARGSRGDSDNGRLLSEWREFEKRSNERDDQYKVKLNILRSKQIESDNVVSALRSNLDAVNKKLDEAIAKFQSAQNDQSRQYGMSPYMYPSMMGSGAPFQPNWYPQYSFAPGDTTMYPQAPMPNTTCAPSSSSADGPNLVDNRLSTVNTVAQQAASPYRDPPATVNIVRDIVQRKSQGDKDVRPKRAGVTAASSGRKNSPAHVTENTASKSRQANGTPTSRNYPTTRSASAAGRDLINRRTQGVSSESPRITLRKTGGGVPDRPTQGSATVQRSSKSTAPIVEIVPDIDMSESWADDHVSDAELVNLADGATPSTRSNTDNASAVQSSSRRGIFEGAIMDARQRVTPSRNDNRADTETNNKDSANVRKGEKRGPDGSSDSGDNDGTAGSYAEVASKYKWNDVSYSPKRRKKSGNAHIPQLEAADSIPLREIFVVNLKYVNCNKPADLEIMVKEHCKTKGVSIIFAKAYLLRFDDTTANCKVVVREADEAKVLANGFWPKRVTARPWLPTPLYQANKGGKAKDDGSNVEPQN